MTQTLKQLFDAVEAVYEKQPQSHSILLLYKAVQFLASELDKSGVLAREDYLERVQNMTLDQDI